jgi:DNA (cytosine-5)-methyltransferase 1
MEKRLPRKVLDLFCGAGGAAMGLHRAWPNARITGVDIKPQKNYPFDFVQADAMTFDLDGYDFLWASPICQKYTQLNFLHRESEYGDFIAAVRTRFSQSGKPWAIENVPNSPLIRGSMKLCGTMFGLATRDGSGELRRHRIFELSFDRPLVPRCQHSQKTVRVFGSHGGLHTLDQRERRVVRVHGHTGGIARGIKMFGVREWKEAMGIDWMTGIELSQAIPPAYSEFIARQVPSL